MSQRKIFLYEMFYLFLILNRDNFNWSKRSYFTKGYKPSRKIKNTVKNKQNVFKPEQKYNNPLVICFDTYF